MSIKRRNQPLFELGEYWLGRLTRDGFVYRFCYDTGDQKVCRKSTGTRDLEQAKTDLARLVLAAPTEDAQSPEKVLMSVILNHYYETHSDQIPGAKQARRSGALLLTWLLDVRDMPEATAASFSTVWQQEFVHWLATEHGHSVSTISRVMSVIFAAMNHAVKRIVIETEGQKKEVQLLKFVVPVLYKTAQISKLTDKPEPVARSWLPTWEQMAEFIDGTAVMTAKGDWDRRHENLFRYLIIALNTWARPAAVLDLNVSTQVNFQGGIIHLNPPGRRQNKKFRPSLPLTDNLRSWLEHWKVDHPVNEKGVPLTTIKKTFRRHAARMGLEHFTPYTLRHFMATNVRRVEGVRVEREQREEWLGHKPQDTTAWYEHFDPEWLREARSATDGIMVRLSAMLKKRTLLPITSQTPLKSGSEGQGKIKLVSSR
jgi:integrase